MRWLRNGYSTPPARQADPVVDRVLDALREHPIATEATRRAFELRQEQRARHAAEIDRLQDEERQQLAAAQAEIDAAAADLAAARQAVAVAERRAKRAADVRVAISLAGTCGLAIRRHTNALAELAEPEIDSLVAELRQLQDRDRGQALSEQRRGGETEVMSGLKTRFVQTNIRSATARTEAIDRAIGAALALKARPDQANLQPELDAIRATIPNVEFELLRVGRRTVESSLVRRDHRAKRRWATDQDEHEAERQAIGAPV